MRKYAYLVVEGPHDVEFVRRVVKPFNLARVRKDTDVDSYFHKLIPTSFPHEGDLLKRMPVPLFLQSETHAVAIHSAGSVSRVVETIEENQVQLAAEQLAAVGVLVDADDVGPIKRFSEISAELPRLGLGTPTNAGEVLPGQPKTGIFVLPDNASGGNIEDLLLECATAEYPSTLASAEQYVQNVKNGPALDGVDLSKASESKKAVIGSIANALQPGRAVQVSIQKNQWLGNNGISLPRIKAVQDFLVDLLEL